MNKERFVEQYTASYLGAMAAFEYHASLPGWQQRTLNPPIEDALFQAEAVWKRGVHLFPYDFVEPQEDVPF